MLLDPSLVLGAWCRPLLSGRRVAVLGDSSTGLGELLSETTGRRVHVLDPDGGRAAAAAARARRATGGPVSYGAIEDLDAIAGACDAVLVPDLSAFADPVAAVAAATALASARGFALVASPNTEGGRPKPLGAAGRGPGYYELYDLLSAEFARVRMLGRAPFVACAIADFSAGADPPVTVDASLLAASEEPDWFVALGSEHELEVDPYTVVEVPAAEAVAWLPGAAAGAEPGRESAALAQAERRMAELTAELAELGRRQQEQARRAQQSEQQATAATARLAELQGELDKERVLRHALETQAQEARRAAERAEAKGQEMRAEMERQRAAARRDADQQRRRTETLEAALREAEAQRERERAVEKPPARTSDREQEAAHGREVSALEHLLQERGRKIEELGAALAESERIGRELIEELGRARAGAAAPQDPPPELEALGRKCAKLEADLTAAQWRVTALQGELDQRPALPGTGREHQLGQALAAAQQELAEARRAEAHRAVAANEQAVLLEQARAAAEAAQRQG